MAAVNPGTGGRRRTRHQVTLPPRTAERVRDRVAAARAASYPSSFSAELERAVDEADGNLRSVRHAIGNDLNPAAAAVAFIRRELQLGRRITVGDLEPIEQAVAKVIGRLDLLTTRVNP